MSSFSQGDTVYVCGDAWLHRNGERDMEGVLYSKYTSVCALRSVGWLIQGIWVSLAPHHPLHHAGSLVCRDSRMSEFLFEMVQGPNSGFVICCPHFLEEKLNKGGRSPCNKQSGVNSVVSKSSGFSFALKEASYSSISSWHGTLNKCFWETKVRASRYRCHTVKECVSWSVAFAISKYFIISLGVFRSKKGVKPCNANRYLQNSPQFEWQHSTYSILLYHL